MGVLSSNYLGEVGKWKPYYYKPFRLGMQDSGTHSEDSTVYVTKTAGSGTSIVRAICIDSHNCGYYYKLIFQQGAPDEFVVMKYDKNDRLIDTLYASSGYKWVVSTNVWITIDVGVWVIMTSNSDFESDDRYTILLPSFDVMEKRRIYHGGYSSYVRMPETEDKSYHTDIIPTNLKGKNITVYFGFFASKDLSFSGLAGPGQLALSKEDTLGNSAVTLALEWNLNPDGDNSEAATGLGTDDTDAYSWASGETWQLGKVFAADVDPRIVDNFPTVAQGISGNIDAPAGADTGTYQKYNATSVGIAGHAKITSQYQDGAGTPTVAASNQFWPVTLLIN